MQNRWERKSRLTFPSMNTIPASSMGQQCLENVQADERDWMVSFCRSTLKRRQHNGVCDWSPVARIGPEEDLDTASGLAIEGNRCAAI